MPKSIKRAIHLIIFLLISLSAGLIGAIFTRPAISTWYTLLEKPFFTPPNWLFAPAWTTLFFLMGTAAFLIFEKGWSKRENKRALEIYFVQLAVNVAWSFLFFGLKSPGLAFADIVLLWLLILITIRKFGEIEKMAGRLLWPYLGWVSFAAVLNLAVWILN